MGSFEALIEFIQYATNEDLTHKRGFQMADVEPSFALAHAVEELGETLTAVLEEAQIQKTYQFLKDKPKIEAHARLKKLERDIVEELGDVFGCLAHFMVQRGVPPREFFDKAIKKAKKAVPGA